MPRHLKAHLERRKTETVNHPAHYGGDTTYEVIKVLEAWGLDKDFNLGNTVKYIARAGKKSTHTTLDDLKKAAWYLARRIQRLEGLQVPDVMVHGHQHDADNYHKFPRPGKLTSQEQAKQYFGKRKKRK